MIDAVTIPDSLKRTSDGEKNARHEDHRTPEEKHTKHVEKKTKKSTEEDFEILDLNDL
jgi:hypothetical protein